MAAKTTHIAVTSIPLFSHQSSIIEFCKRLIHLHQHIHVTCIFPTIDAPIPASLKLLESLPPSIHCTFLPPINQQDLPQDILKIDIAVSRSVPHFRESLRSLCCSSSNPVTALITDPFASQTLEIAKEFNLLTYMYFPVSAMTTSLHLNLLTLHEQVSCEYKDHTEPIQLPGCIPFHGSDLPPEFFRDRSSFAYEVVLEHTKRFSLADGVLVNSFSELEEDTVRANNITPLYLVGPIIQTGDDDCSNSNCMNWLDNQRKNSVLYVSFGSRGTLSQQQLNELAFGLESSGQKFVWVLRKPNDSAYEGDLNDNDDALKYLPNGFLTRTKEQGLVVPGWAPQTQILKHSSTGGFLTHCGWNSILESIVFGVPMITWPLFGEQRMNTTLLTEGLKVALRLKFNENGIAEREEIAKVIRDLMFSKEIRQKIEELKDAADGTLSDNGSSTMTISRFRTLIGNKS